MVGNGGICGYHLEHLTQFDDVEFVGFHDVIRERAVARCEQTNGKRVYDSLEDMLDDSKPDALYICVPPNQHGHIEQAAIDRGINFFCEKPIALDLAMAHRIRDGVEAKGLITAVGFQDRYLDIIQNVKGWLGEHKVGMVSGAWIGGIPGVEWWPHYATSGGQIVEQNIHLFDMIRYLFGEPARVYCTGSRGIVTKEDYDLHDFSTAVVTMKSGLVVTLHTGCFRPNGPSDPNCLCILCDDADITYKLRSYAKLTTAETTLSYRRMTDQGIPEDRTFLDAVKSGDPSKIRSPYSDACKSLALTLACNESLFTGKVIELA